MREDDYHWLRRRIVNQRRQLREYERQHIEAVYTKMETQRKRFSYLEREAAKKAELHETIRKLEAKVVGLEEQIEKLEWRKE